MNIDFVSFYDFVFLEFSNCSDSGVFFVFHFISKIFLLNVGTVQIVWYLFFILFPRLFCWWNSGLGCAQYYGELKPVDGILVWDVHNIMGSSNQLMEFWFGMCTNLWWAQTEWWNSGLGCAQIYCELKPVDGILVWDVHKIMASSNWLMEFWFGICTKLWRAQTGRWNFNPLLLIMGYPTEYRYTQTIANTTHIRFHSSTISTFPSWYLDIQQQYTQTISNTLHRFTSTPAYYILSHNVMPT